jgi:uncharacterized protein (TIGR03437 family)
LVVSGSKAMLLLGNGDGTFRSVDLGFMALFTLVADVNRDKKADLLVQDGSKAFLLLGNGDGTFQPAKPLPAFPLAVADFNGDGNPDLLSAGVYGAGQCASDSIVVYPGNGDGTFRNPLPCSGGNTFQGDWGIQQIAVGDVNNDGKLDVVWSPIRGTQIYVWMGNGDGTFQPPASVDALASHGGRPIAIGDLNHDGKPDIIIGNSAGVTVLLGNGDGTFRSPVYPPVGPPMSPQVLWPFYGYYGHQRLWTESNDIFLRDFDGDGNLDIVNDDLLFRGNGDGTFQPAQFLNAGSPNAVSLICDDLNGDGKPDLVYLPAQLVFLTGSATKLSILLNISPGGLPNAVLGYSAATGDSLLALGSIGSIYGKALAKVTASAVGATFPTQLGGISLRVRDDTDTVRLAPLIYVSPTQINFQVPAATNIGPVTLTIDDGSTPLLEAANATIVIDIAAGFFAANGSGKGVAAATALRMRADGTQEPIGVFSCTSAGQCSEVPIDMTSGLPVYLTLYGTGFRNAYPAMVTGGRCQVGSKNATIQFAGPQPVYPGLDQLNLLLPNSLPSGVLPVQCRFASNSNVSVSNVVQIAIK